MSQRGRRSSWTHTIATLAATCFAFLALTQVASAATIFSDGFESDFSGWSAVTTAGDGTAAIQSTQKVTGLNGAQFSESVTSSSKAYARKTFSAAQQDITLVGDFKLLSANSSGNTPFFRLFDPAAARIISLYRQNDSTGTIQFSYGPGPTRLVTTAKLALNTWANISLHIIFNGANSTIVVRFNDAIVYSTSAASLGTAGASTFQIGNDTGGQAFNMAMDNINVQNGAPSDPTAPMNTALPSISGTPQAGQTLTAGNGVWTSATPITYTYAWQSCSAGTCTPITGATNQTYLVADGDVGKTLKVAVTAKNDVGSNTATSNATTVVAGPNTPPVNTTAPTISGTATSGQTLTANPGAWTGTQPMTFAYAWSRCTSLAVCTAIGTSSPSYTLTPTEVGSTIKVTVTGTNAAGNASSTSTPTAVVQAAPPPPLPGLVAQWHMDETSGTTMFDSAGTHHGALKAGVQLGQPGFSGLAYRFSGSSYVSVAHANDLNPGSANMTATIRVKTTLAPAQPDWDMMRKGYYVSNGGEYKVEEQPSGQATCGFKGSSGYAELTAGPRINDGNWHTVQCVKNPTSITLVVDGVKFNKSGTVGAIANTDIVPIGARPGSEFFQGLLDEASIQVG